LELFGQELQIGGPTQSVELLRVVDDDAQALFDNCFAIINGPDAPATKVVELDKEIISCLVIQVQM
jgi:hypothetical protein